MSTLSEQARAILEVAAEGQRENSEDTAIVVTRQGGMRMLAAAGWSLAGLIAEFGAASVYRVERRGGTIRVEAGNGLERCFIERAYTEARPSNPPVLPAPPASYCAYRQLALA